MAPKQAGSAAGPSKASKKSAKVGSSSAGQSSAAVDQPDEEPLVAIILADSYDSLYSPLTVDTPRCLLPLANVPLINFSIESAARTGVAHIYIFSSAHTQRIRDHITGHSDDEISKGMPSIQESLQAQDIAITVVGTPEARSEGDALRELDAKQILRSDFLLYRCDSVVTTDLRPLVQEHRERRKADKDAIMTMVCMSPGAGPESYALQPVHYIDPTTNQVLHYEMTRKTGQSSRDKLSMPLELLRLDEKSGYDEIDIRCDLVEAGVDICSIDVPPLFSENFDYQSFSLDFVPGILTSDLLESKIFIHQARQGYAGRAQDTQAYHAIVNDVLRKRTSPISPGSSAWLGEELYEEQGSPSRRFLSPLARLQSGSYIGARAMVAAGCQVEATCVVSGSVLAAGVTIGKGSSIRDSHLHARVKIGEDVGIQGSIIGENASILDGVTLQPGCLIGARCVIGPNVTLATGTRVGSKSQATWEDEEEDEEVREAAPVETLGEKARGHLWSNFWVPVVNDDSDDDDETEDPTFLRRRCIGFASDELGEDEGEANDDDTSVSSVDEDSEMGDDTDDDTGASSIAMAGGDLTDLTLGGGVSSKLEEEAASKRLAGFDAEAHASLSRALLEGYSADNALLELKTLRMASNVQPREVQRIAVDMFLGECTPSDGRQVQVTVKRWHTILSAMAAEEGLETMLAMQAYCASTEHGNSYGPLFVPLVKLLYNEDVVSDETVVAWWRSKPAQTGSDAMLELRRKASDIVRYILEDSDDDDEDEEDESE